MLIPTSSRNSLPGTKFVPMKFKTAYWLPVFLSALFLTGCNSESKKEQAEEVVIDPNAVTWVPDITEALAKAKATGKLLFVECYSPTCPICQSIEPHFSTPEVAGRYNTDFVNYKLDVGVAEQVKFLNDRNIWLPSFPQFLFFDGDGKLVHQGEVTATTESILGVADDAMSPEKRTGNYKSRFEKGERDFDFLVKYGVYTRLIKDTTENRKVGDALFEVFPKNEINSETSWAATKKVVTSVDNGFFKHWINQMPRAAEFEKKAGHAGQEMHSLGTIVQTSIAKDARSYSTRQLAQIKDYIRKVGGGEYADTYVWEYEVLANLREGKAQAALSIGKNMAAKFAGSGASLVYITKVFNDKFPGNDFLPAAREWMNTAAPQLAEPNQKAEYHYELARMNLKGGDKAAAAVNAREAMKLAETAGTDLKKFNELLNSVK